MATRPTTHN